MPSKSAKQHKFMLAVAHDPQFAAKANIPQSVAQEFVDADNAMTREHAKKRIAKALLGRKSR